MGLLVHMVNYGRKFPRLPYKVPKGGRRVHLDGIYLVAVSCRSLGEGGGRWDFCSLRLAAWALHPIRIRRILRSLGSLSRAVQIPVLNTKKFHPKWGRTFLVEGQAHVAQLANFQGVFRSLILTVVEADRSG